MDKSNLVAIEGQKNKPEETEKYCHPHVRPVLDWVENVLDTYGCSEMIVIMLDEDLDCHWDSTDENHVEMLGNLSLIKHRYERDFDEDLE